MWSCRDPRISKYCIISANNQSPGPKNVCARVCVQLRQRKSDLYVRHEQIDNTLWAENKERAG